MQETNFTSLFGSEMKIIEDKAKRKSTIEILEALEDVSLQYPELTFFLNEMNFNYGVNNFKEIDSKQLDAYYTSLVDILNKYKLMCPTKQETR